MCGVEDQEGKLYSDLCRSSIRRTSLNASFRFSFLGAFLSSSIEPFRSLISGRFHSVLLHFAILSITEGQIPMYPCTYCTITLLTSFSHRASYCPGPLKSNFTPGKRQAMLHNHNIPNYPWWKFLSHVTSIPPRLLSSPELQSYKKLVPD
jgi:hypothetical protein